MEAKTDLTEGSINLNRLHFPVSTLGYGQRIAIWMQGCSLHCPGCISQDTWAHGQGQVPFSKLNTNLERWLPQADGLTVSGGEPFEQPQALERLLCWWRLQHAGDILVFSGYSWEHLSSQHAGLLATTGRYLFEDGQDAAAKEFLLRAEAINPRHSALIEARELIARSQNNKN